MTSSRSHSLRFCTFWFNLPSVVDFASVGPVYAFPFVFFNYVLVWSRYFGRFSFLSVVDDPETVFDLLNLFFSQRKKNFLFTLFPENIYPHRYFYLGFQNRDVLLWSKVFIKKSEVLNQRPASASLPSQGSRWLKVCTAKWVLTSHWLDMQINNRKNVYPASDK